MATLSCIPPCGGMINYAASPHSGIGIGGLLGMNNDKRLRINEWNTLTSIVQHLTSKPYALRQMPYFI